MTEPIRWQDAWWHQQPDGSWLRFDEESQQWQLQAPPQPAYAQPSGMSTGSKVAIGVTIGFVVLLIVAILAAIAIPVFLRQREKGWEAQVDSALRRAALAQEEHCLLEDQYGSCYSGSIDELIDRTGLTYASDVELRVAAAGDDSYCIEGRHRMIEADIWSYDSGVGRPVPGPCRS